MTTLTERADGEPTISQPNGIWVDGQFLDLEDTDAATPLAEVLRAAGHTQVKNPCGEGVCGACTVQVDSRPMASCLLPAARAVNRTVRTAGSIAHSESGEALATEFAKRNGAQCGYCIPGLLASGAARVAEVHAEAARRGNEPPPGAPTLGALDTAYHRPDILDGHLCRCTGYQGLQTGIDRASTRTGTGVPERVDGRASTSGTLPFATDQAPPHTLVGLLLTARSPHARVTVEPGTAMTVRGAVAVLGPTDLTARTLDRTLARQPSELTEAEPAIFSAEARWYGDVVGLVIAKTPGAAREMARLVVQTETPLPAVTRTEEAPVALDLHRGDLAAFEQRVGQTTRVLTTHHDFAGGPHGSLEPPSAVAMWSDDTLHLWSTNQAPSNVSAKLADFFDLPVDSVICHAVPLGGGFGIKESIWLEPIAAHAARYVGRPVAIAPTHAQVLLSRRRPSGSIDVTTVIGEDGTVVGRKVDVVLDAGGRLGDTGLLLEHVLQQSLRTHKIEIQCATGVVVITNTVQSAVADDHAIAALTFALDSHLDEIAREFGADPVEFRVRHSLRAGDIDPVHATPLTSFAAREALEEVGRQRRHRIRPSTSRWRRGRGLSFTSLSSGFALRGRLDEATARIRVDDEGLFVVETVLPEVGSGGYTMLTGVVAERLGVPQARVRVEQVPADESLHDRAALSGRLLAATANAVASAADEIHRELRLVSGADLTPLGMSIGNYVMPMTSFHGVQASARVSSPEVMMASAHLVDVAVDVATGQIAVERVVCASDVGRLVDPDLARTHVLGAVVEGIGATLSERQRVRAGIPIDLHLGDVGLPTAGVAPEIDDLWVGDASEPGVLGLKGIGAGPMAGVPAAIANAVFDAVGVRYTALPLDPETVLAGLQSAGVTR